MSSAHLTITQALVSALSQAPAIAGGRIYSGRMRAMPAEHASAVFVGLARSEGRQPFASDARTDWSTHLALDICARASAGQDGLAAVDALLDAVYTRLASTTPPADVPGWLIDSQIAWEIEEADQTLAVATLVLRIDHRTASGSLTAA